MSVLTLFAAFCRSALFLTWPLSSLIVSFGFWLSFSLFPVPIRFEGFVILFALSRIVEFTAAVIDANCIVSLLVLCILLRSCSKNGAKNAFSRSQGWYAASSIFGLGFLFWYPLRRRYHRSGKLFCAVPTSKEFAVCDFSGIKLL